MTVRPWRHGMELGREFRSALRALRRAPGFSAAVIVTLALCIGPNTAILSVLYSLVLKPLPFREPEQLVRIANVAEKSGGTKYPSSFVQYRDFCAQADRFEGFALLWGANFTIGEESTPVRAWSAQVTADLFKLLEVEPLIGRFFTAEEQASGRDRVLVLTQTFWETHYLADREIVGREVRLGGEPFTIVGVAPRRLEALDAQIRFFKPYEETKWRTEPEARYRVEPTLFGRLKTGTTVAEGKAQLEVLERRFYTESANAETRAFLDQMGARIDVARLRDDVTAHLKAPLLTLQGGALFVLLIGCVNVANLWLARVNAKRAEFAIRYALGAGGGAILRQILHESFLLTFAAAVVGAGLAWGGVRLFNHYLPLINGSMSPVTIEPEVLGWIVAAVCLVALLVGVMPFALLRRHGLTVTATRAASASRRVRWLSGALVISQVAVALVLLVGAGLLIQSLAKVLAVDMGFDASRIVQGRIAFPKGYEDAKTNVAAHQRILAAMKEIPGVEQAAYVSDFGLAPSLPSFRFLLRGISLGSGGNQPMVQGQLVSPDYFATMGIRLREGRLFNDADLFGGGAGQVAIVDELFVDRFLPPGRSAIDHEIFFDVTAPSDTAAWVRIIGVVGRAQLAGPERRDVYPFVYVPANQRPMPGITLLLRTTRPLPDVLKEMRAKLRAIDSRLPLYATTTLQGAVDGMLTQRRGLVLLLGIFAGLALLLAAIGLYGVLAYDVTQRTREIGIRAAIGATRGQIAGLILRQGLWKCAAGVAAGLGGAFYLTRFLRGFLFDVQPTDPGAFLGVSLVLLAVAAFASWLPARRAAKVDPIVALRAE